MNPSNYLSAPSCIGKYCLGKDGINILHTSSGKLGSTEHDGFSEIQFMESDINDFSMKMTYDYKPSFYIYKIKKMP